MVIGLGIDLVDIDRIERMLEKDAERAMARLLTAAEWGYCARMHSPAIHVAVRLAAKEAAFKALAGSMEARGIGWKEIEVVHDEHRRPSLRLDGRATARATELGVSRSHLSLSHSEKTASAVVVLERDA
ncbi:MAG: holo-ACP synthase [Gemmatimonadaceae bacterium]